MRIPKSLYYLYDNRWFDKKWDVFDYANTEGHLKFNVTRDVRVVLNKNFGFDMVDWTIEPEKSWEQITYERMMNIRDSHPKIMLWYSGGSDSHYILELCLRHNIKIDEICICRTEYKNFPNEWFNHDTDNYAIPFVKKYASHIPLYVHIGDDWGAFDTDNTLSFENFFSHNNIFLSNNARAYVDTHKKYYEKGFVMIHGSTEPTVVYDHNDKKYYADLWDTDNFLDRNSLTNTIAFFTNPEVPEIHIKQCHLVKNYLRENFDKGNTIDVKKDYEEYKNIYCKLTRNNYRVPDVSPHFAGYNSHSIFGSKKQQVFAKAIAKADVRIGEKYHHFLCNSIRNKPIYKFPRGVRIGKFCLE